MAKRGRPSLDPTDEERKMVSQMAAVGIPHEQIALVVRDGISADTLTRHFKEELRTARVKANARIGGTLYNKAINGDTTAAIFWAKTQMGWAEKTVNEHHGPDGGPIRIERVIVDPANAPDTDS